MELNVKVMLVNSSSLNDNKVTRCFYLLAPKKMRRLDGVDWRQGSWDKKWGSTTRPRQFLLSKKKKKTIFTTEKRNFPFHHHLVNCYTCSRIAKTINQSKCVQTYFFSRACLTSSKWEEKIDSRVETMSMAIFKVKLLCVAKYFENLCHNMRNWNFSSISFSFRERHSPNDTFFFCCYW